MSVGANLSVASRSEVSSHQSQHSKARKSHRKKGPGRVSGSGLKASRAQAWGCCGFPFFPWGVFLRRDVVRACWGSRCRALPLGFGLRERGCDSHRSGSGCLSLWCWARSGFTLRGTNITSAKPLTPPKTKPLTPPKPSNRQVYDRSSKGGG